MGFGYGPGFLLKMRTGLIVHDGILRMTVQDKLNIGRGGYFLEVTVYQNQVEKALKVLKRQMTKEGLLKELKRRRFYEKPSVKKKRKQKEAKKKRKAALKRRRSFAM